MSPPLECAMCGMPRWNDTTVRWIDGFPYCAGWCADTVERLRSGAA